MGQDFSTWLNQKLDKIKWSQDTLARKLGVRQASVSKWVSGKTKPSRDNVMKLAEVLGESPDMINRLLGYSNEKPKDRYLETIASLWSKIPEWKKRDILAQVQSASDNGLGFSELLQLAKRLTADQRAEVLRLLTERNEGRQESEETG